MIWGPLVFICVCYFCFRIIFFCVFDSDITLTFYEKFGKKISHLKGKVIVITGASSGIGESLAIHLARNGVKLALIARREMELFRVKNICLQSGLNFNDVLIVPFDITEISNHQVVFDKILRHFGTIDIVVNNAGRSQRAVWENIEVNVDRQLFELNVFSVINFSRIFAKYFLSRGNGHIAVVSSLAGVLPAPFSASYTGSKHAIHGYMNSLRFEKIDKNLDVTLFCPGPTFTNFLAECFTEKSGQVFGGVTNVSDRRMSSDRCGYLLAVALSNKLTESWVAVFPILPLTHILINYSTISQVFMKYFGPKFLLNLRDSRDSMPKQINL